MKPTILTDYCCSFSWNFRADYYKCVKKCPFRKGKDEKTWKETFLKTQFFPKYLGDCGISHANDIFAVVKIIIQFSLVNAMFLSLFPSTQTHRLQRPQRPLQLGRLVSTSQLIDRAFIIPHSSQRCLLSWQIKATSLQILVCKYLCNPFAPYILTEPYIPLHISR